MAAVSMTAVLGDGTNTLLWTDSWATVGPLCRFTPDLFAAVSRAGKRRLVKDGLMLNRWARDVEGALTAQVLCQFLRVWHLMQNVVLNPLQADRFVWRWSSDGKYFASSTYRAFFNGSTSLLGAKELWRAKVPPKVKFFFLVGSSSQAMDGGAP